MYKISHSGRNINRQTTWLANRMEFWEVRNRIPYADIGMKINISV
jgi:hypothetical protein